MDIEVLIRRLEALEKKVETLEKENASLKERLAKYENPKNSRNSSIPPSKDENRPAKNQSLRTPSGKKPGGQKGREGKTLEMKAFPDVVIELQPDYCNNCGASLQDRLSIKGNSRQVVDIPPIKAVYTEYQRFSKICKCGCQNTADFPQRVNAPVSYGENIEALIAYFHARQHLPFARMKETFNNIFGVNISEGGIHYLLNKFGQKTTPVYEIIKQRVQQSYVVGTDETGVKVNGKKHWFWTWQTSKLTFITHSNNRGSETINREFPLGFPQSTLVHDGWKAQLKTTSQNHQSCLAHLQRALNYLDQRYPNDNWGKDFKNLLSRSLKLKDKLELQNREHQLERTSIIQNLDYLLERPPERKNKELYTFYKRMCREKQYLFTFLFLDDVPSDNNASERAIRNVKVKQKISGQFKTEKAAQNFAKIRSVIDTTIKSGLNVLESLNLLAKIHLDLQTD
ncbi:IS66 family transposase [Antarcticibacterium flavum]|uniref:IS66 family transposase n=1 Tax=Antarcticibacterium flavum TaxID=2058175 RepID=A0A5B7X6H6_9FLAO|nr:IS66 family transposase [Antarcticibacterium flavum]